MTTSNNTDMGKAIAIYGHLNVSLTLKIEKMGFHDVTNTLLHNSRNRSE